LRHPGHRVRDALRRDRHDPSESRRSQKTRSARCHGGESWRIEAMPQAPERRPTLRPPHGPGTPRALPVGAQHSARATALASILLVAAVGSSSSDMFRRASISSILEHPRASSSIPAKVVNGLECGTRAHYARR
jgi:hypothetical protein